MASGIINTVGLRPQIVHSAGGTGGQAGYIRICRITILQAWASAPIRLTLSQRGRPTCQIGISFENVDSIDPAVRYFIYDSPQENLVNTAFLYKASTSTWDLYIQKLENYDHIDVYSVDIPFYQQGRSLSVTWMNDQQNTALAWTHSATKAYQFIEEYAITPTSLVGSVGTYNYVGKIGRVAICCFNLYLQSSSSAGSIYLTNLPIPIKNVGFAMVGNNNGRRFRIDPSGRMMNDDPTVTESWYNGSITYITAS